jgi:phosphohistidine swiveling domain-containing protein
VRCWWWRRSCRRWRTSCRRRALVTEHGGATSHGATLAREYGVPAVLGVAGATALADGAQLYVDGAAGRVYPL